MYFLKRVILLYFIVSFSSLHSTNEKGSLFIVSESGFRVYLNNELVGVTSDDEGGIWIKKLEPGQIKVKMQKKNYNPIFFKAIIISSKVLEKNINTLDYLQGTKEEKNKTMLNPLRFDGYYFCSREYDDGLIFKKRRWQHIIIEFDSKTGGSTCIYSGRESPVPKYPGFQIGLKQNKIDIADMQFGYFRYEIVNKEIIIKHTDGSENRGIISDRNNFSLDDNEFYFVKKK